ncbi:hypothetical protein [Mycetocola spongiae]|uniref:hypothetical protein n=1 Tax=Mycetocola spongiae TaxID=2859226 RepID=UPI001CF5C919|nr:hypothetical protein [Mycetocola spongiae]UCR88937.1 hypothetical protein KXZ72_13465 [Mycetocola spongiae]
MSRVVEFAGLLERVAVPLRVACVLVEEGRDISAPPGMGLQAGVTYRYWQPSVAGSVYEVEGELQYWLTDERYPVQERVFSGGSVEDMVRVSLLMLYGEARRSMGMTGLDLVVPPTPVVAVRAENSLPPEPVAAGFMIHQERLESARLTEVATGKMWSSDQPYLLTDFSVVYRYPLEELAALLVSSDGGALAGPGSGWWDPSQRGWNDDRSRPYDAAYNAGLLAWHPEIWR